MILFDLVMMDGSVAAAGFGAEKAGLKKRC